MPHKDGSRTKKGGEVGGRIEGELYVFEEDRINTSVRDTNITRLMESTPEIIPFRGNESQSSQRPMLQSVD